MDYKNKYHKYNLKNSTSSKDYYSLYYITDSKNHQSDIFYKKYCKYKKKYLDLKTLINGGAAAASAPKDKDIANNIYN